MASAPRGVILAGGAARRMGGGDKSLLDLGGRPILSHVIERFAPQVGGLDLSANGDPARFAHFGLRVIADEGEPHGPLAGILAALEAAAAAEYTHVVSVAGDTPFLPGDLVPQLMLAAEAQGRPVALAATPDGAGGVRRHPTFGLWPVALRHDLRAALAIGTRRVSEWAERHGVALASFPVDRGDPFLNVNTPEDLEAARRM